MFHRFLIILTNLFSDIWRIVAAALGAVFAWLEPTIPFGLICIFAVVIDCWTAYRLGCRVKRFYPESSADGKFKSRHALKMLDTLCVVYMCITLMYAVEQHIVTFANWYLPNITAGVFCLVEVVSILENESSCNGSAWAVVAQKILADKTERHLNINIKNAIKTGKDNEKDK